MAEEQAPGQAPSSDPANNPAPDAPASADASAAAPASAEPVIDPTAAPAEAPVADDAAAAVASTESVAEGAIAAVEEASADMASIEELLKNANFEDPAQAAANSPVAPGAEQFKLPNFQQVMADAQVSSIDLLRDVELNVKIELGRSRMLVEEVLKLSEGSVVELDKLAGDPVDVFVNERLVARGEVLVLNDMFCVRVNEIVAGVKDEGL